MCSISMEMNETLIDLVLLLFSSQNMQNSHWEKMKLFAKKNIDISNEMYIVHGSGLFLHGPCKKIA